MGGAEMEQHVSHLIGIEKEPAYCRMARRRIERPHAPVRKKEKPMPLFDDMGEDTP